MQTSTRQKFIMTQQLLPGLINGLLNGGIAWAQHRETAALGLWDQGAYATDLLATGFLLPALSWLIVRPLLRHQAANGKAPELSGLARPWLTRWMRPSLWGGTAAIGLQTSIWLMMPFAVLVGAGWVSAMTTCNIAVQLLGQGVLSDLAEARRVIAASTELKFYQPQDAKAWEAAYLRYQGIFC